MYRYTINSHFNGYTIKEFLEFFKLSSKKINRIIHEKKYLVNGSICETLKTGDELFIEKSIFNEQLIKTEYKQIEILYEDDYILIINKPDNMIIHSDNDKEITLDNIVAGYFEKKGLEPISRHTYRLDRNTTGCMVYAKDPLTLSYLSYAVENKEMFKIYRAIVYGNFDKKEGVLDYPIGTNRHINGKMVICKNGKPSITNYKVIDEMKGKSLVEIKLETGRTHQIRLHMSYIGHPVIGDNVYGSYADSNLCLQATSVEFLNPYNKKRLTVEVSHKLSL